jgi:hypothetical protein
MLQRASDAAHIGYGGSGEVDSDRLYSERGTALAFLASWAEEARVLTRDLEYTHLGC